MIVSGHELRRWRAYMGYTQERAAQKLGIGLRTYKAYEHIDEVRTTEKRAAQIPGYIGLACIALLKGFDGLRLGMVVPNVRKD